MFDMFGTIITLAVSLSVILIFRQVDKGSKSLGKVAKYADKIRGDLEQYFREQSEKLRNAAVDLDVKQTQAIAAVKRLEKQAELFGQQTTALEAQLQTVEAVRKRIDGYDSLLRELDEMAARVETNLAKIRDESAFLDKTTKKITEQHNLLDGLEKTIPRLQQEFSDENRRNLEQTGDTLLNRYPAGFSNWKTRLLLPRNKMPEFWNSLLLQRMRFFRRRRIGPNGLKATFLMRFPQKRPNVPMRSAERQRNSSKPHMPVLREKWNRPGLRFGKK